MRFLDKKISKILLVGLVVLFFGRSVQLAHAQEGAISAVVINCSALSQEHDCDSNPGCSWMSATQKCSVIGQPAPQPQPQKVIPVMPAGQAAPAAANPCSNSGTNGVDLSQCFLLNSTTTVGSVFSSPAALVNLTVKIIFLLSGIILFFMIIYSGFLFISGGTKGQEQASKVLTSAVVGFIIVFSAYWIMQIIRIVTGADIGF